MINLKEFLCQKIKEMFVNKMELTNKIGRNFHKNLKKIHDKHGKKFH